MDTTKVPKPSIELSVVVPCYREAAIVPVLKDRLRLALQRITACWEVIFVDDGSEDGTFDQLAAAHIEDSRFKLLALSRNFGQQAALHAGLTFAAGEYVGILDADLQDPPELLAEAMKRIADGFDVVYMVRHRRKEGFFKRSMYTLWYRLVRLTSDVKIPLDAGDFCIMTRPVVEVLKRLPERPLLLRGLRSWVGFRQTGIAYDRPQRLAGKTKISYRRNFSLALVGFLDMSSLPLRIVSIGGVVLVCVALAGMIALCTYAITKPSVDKMQFSGTGFVIALGFLCALGAFNGLALALYTQYLARIYAETRGRPRWIIRKTIGFGPSNEATIPNGDHLCRALSVNGESYVLG
jgi:polyisoprenyl-phosphate glycosyltransferase